MKPPRECGDDTQRKGAHLSALKRGIIKTRQATKKNTDPNIAQKLPILAMQKPIAEITKRIQPIK
ncbi:MAG: hypothetical protein ACI91Z_000176 [Yoonia sp.]|jgi:hypothetical protein